MQVDKAIWSSLIRIELYLELTDKIPCHRQLASNNTITSLKLLMCTRSMLKELSKCSKLQSLEIIEASVIQDSDLAEFSHGKVS